MVEQSELDRTSRNRSGDRTQGEASVLEIDSLVKKFGSLTAVDLPSLSLRDGEFFTLLGPSGSGKSTLLRMIAGLEQPTRGRMALRGEDVTTVPANKRSTALIFQDFQLFPHKTVEENVAFPLKMEGVSKAERREQASEMLSFVDLAGYEKRYPEKLSGGEKQRVSLARGLISEPDILLLDEPLASLDRNLRNQLQVELRKYQRRLGITFIYVTHDQEVALTVSDRIAVMEEGSIVQVDDPVTVYKEPNTRFVAEFLGEVNSIDGSVERVADGRVVTSNGGVEMSGLAGDSIEEGGEGVLVIKSENASIAPAGEGGETSLDGTLRDVIFTGKTHTYLVDLDHVELEAEDFVVSEALTDDGTLSVGDPVTVTWEPTDAYVFEAGE